jgi:hypothetical protein
LLALLGFICNLALLQGKTEAEALANLREALELHFEAPQATISCLAFRWDISILSKGTGNREQGIPNLNAHQLNTSITENSAE